MRLGPSVASPPDLSRVDCGVRDSSCSPDGSSVVDATAEILSGADSLGIPWKRILVDEIQAEQRLRRHFRDIDKEFSLRAVVKILACSCLRSWRVRDQFERLSRKARKIASDDAVRQLRILFAALVGRVSSRT